MRLVLRIAIALAAMLALAGATPDTVKRKAAQAVAQLEQAMSDGRDVSAIVPKMKRVKTIADGGDLAAADALLDEVLSDFARLDGPATNDGPYGDPQLARITGYDGDAMEPFLSRDGETLFFNDLGQGPAKKDLHWATRVSDLEFAYQGRLRGVNSDTVDGVPSMDREGRFYFVSLKDYAPRNRFATVYSGRFAPEAGAVVDARPHPELSRNQAGWVNMDLEISADGETLYFTQSYFQRGTNFPERSYFVAARKSGDAFEIDANSAAVFATINGDGRIDGDGMVYAASISADERTIFFTRARREDGAPRFSTHMATRADPAAPFGEPILLAAITGFAEAPAVSPTGDRLYYHKRLPTPDGPKFRIMMLTRR